MVDEMTIILVQCCRQDIKSDDDNDDN